MPYDVPDLGKMFEKAEQKARDAGQRIAEDGLDAMEHNIEINTPVETRHLRDSYKQRAIVYGAYDAATGADWGYGARDAAGRWTHGTKAYAWTGTVFTEVDYALYVEKGTGLWGPRHAKYKIAPKKPGGMLAFQPYHRTAAGGVILDVHSGSPSKSGTIFVRYVMHPGSPGAEMFQIGTILTEAQKDHWSETGLRLFEADLQGML